MDYPADRGNHFGLRVCRLLHKTAAAQEIGTAAAYLVTLVALQEDAKRYTGAVYWWDEQLMPCLGVKSKATMTTIRERVIKSGWLVYNKGTKGTASTYWTLIPKRFEKLEDGYIGEEFGSNFEPNPERIANESRTNPERILNESGAIHTSSLPFPKGKECAQGGKTDERTGQPDAYIDWITTNAEFLRVWNDSPRTVHASKLSHLEEGRLRELWEDPVVRAKLYPAIARLARGFWSIGDRRVSLARFLDLRFVEDVVGGRYDNVDGLAKSGGDVRPAGKRVSATAEDGKRRPDDKPGEW